MTYRPSWSEIGTKGVVIDAEVPWPHPFAKGTCRWCLQPAATPRSTWCGRKDYSDIISECRDAVFSWWWSAHWVRRAVFKRDKFTCLACCSPAPLIEIRGVAVPDLGHLHADHVVPLHLGGRHHFENLQTLCAACNLAKGAKTEWQPRLISCPSGSPASP